MMITVKETRGITLGIRVGLGTKGRTVPIIKNVHKTHTPTQKKTKQRMGTSSFIMDIDQKT